MNRKSLIIFVLVVGALVFDGFAHFHKKNSDVLSEQELAGQNQAQNVAASNLADAARPQTQDQATNAGDPNAANDATSDAAANNGGNVQANGNENGNDATADVATNAGTNDAPTDASQAAPDPIIVPAGTTLSVRLAEELGSNISNANQRFAAALDRDVVVHGQTVIPAGSTVHGRVVLAKSPGQLAGEAKLELRLTSVSLNNGTVTILTSTRTFGPTIKGKNKVGKFMKGLVKRASGQEREVLLAEQTPCSFTLERRLAIQ